MRISIEIFGLFEMFEKFFSKEIGTNLKRFFFNQKKNEDDRKCTPCEVE